MIGREMGDILQIKSWTQVAFAEYLGMSTRQINAIARGDKPVPRRIELLLSSLPVRETAKLIENKLAKATPQGRRTFQARQCGYDF